MNSEQPTVFIVDDDEAVRDSLSWLMSSVGLAAKSFSSARVFLDTYAPSRPGCVVLDIRMPGMSGLDLQEQIRKRGIELPLIFISGHADVPMAVRALKSGAFDFIEKPFNDQVLLECVQRAIEEDEEHRRRWAAKADVVGRLNLLTPREREVLDLVVEGASNKVISNSLGVSLKTVEAHRARVMEKLQAGSLSELVRLVLFYGDSP
ncbi:response regulator transcription factor [Thiohalomonas denitrificans]|uniref:response regulator transcription factor n=1 Tax=Thiohalomonas denitrificans TaxID=415747 RepID=UPI0026EEA6B7|nr:response regulator transcription factor [Thiohalomonas denitrificans]